MSVFVITSEYSRRVAHELDDSRTRWLNKRKGKFLDYLPASIKLLVPPDINHATYLGDKVNLLKHYADASSDMHVLQMYLTELKTLAKEKSFKVNGEDVSSTEFFYHRKLVIAEMEYKRNLVLRLGQQVKRQNIMRSNLMDGLVSEIDGKRIPAGVELVRGLVAIIKSKSNKEPSYYDENAKLWIERAQAYLANEAEKYLLDIKELYADDTPSMNHFGEIVGHGEAMTK